VLRREASQMAIVLDEHGGTAGLITIQDIGEEIVGQVERAGAAPDIYQDAFGRLRVAGTVRIAEVGERLGVVLGHAEVDSVSGLVLALLDRPPLVGDIVEHRGVRFQVTAVAGHGVRECTVAVSNDANR
jgi:CBS domain containing-hemolysin-like protein